MTDKRFNKKFFIGIAVAFLLPLSFYLIAKALRKDQINMPGYFLADRVDTVILEGKTRYDTVFHQVHDLELTNQFGELVSLNSDLRGKILVINFFFTACPSVCPKLTDNIRMLQNAFRKDPKKEFKVGDSIHFVSITVDPVRDSFQVLRRYADKFGVDHDSWSFLTGDKHMIYQYARKELRVATPSGDGGADDFIHSEKIIVLDRNRFIRGYYDGLDTAAIKKCADDIVLLTMEKNRKK